MTKKNETKTDAVAETPQSSLTVTSEQVVSALEVAAEMGLGTFDMPQVKVPSGDAGLWAVLQPDGTKKHLEAFEGIIVAMNPKERSWWAVDYDERGADDSPIPQCSSLDGVTGFGVREALSDAEPSEQACADCKWSQWGSDRRGRSGQDCKQQGVAAVLLPGQHLPTIVTIPPSSAGAIKTYGVELLSIGRRMDAVMTKFSLEPAKSGDGKAYCKVILSSARVLSGEEQELVQAVRPAAKELLLNRPTA